VTDEGRSRRRCKEEILEAENIQLCPGHVKYSHFQSGTRPHGNGVAFMRDFERLVRRSLNQQAKVLTRSEGVFAVNGLKMDCERSFEGCRKKDRVCR
jgi:hypothetical protein